MHGLTSAEDDHWLSPAGHTIAGTSQGATGLFGHLGTHVRVQTASNQHFLVLFHQAAFQALCPKLSPL